jgi:hypothetical protein
MVSFDGGNPEFDGSLFSSASDLTGAFEAGRKMRYSLPQSSPPVIEIPTDADLRGFQLSYLYDEPPERPKRRNRRSR